MKSIEKLWNSAVSSSCGNHAVKRLQTGVKDGSEFYYHMNKIAWIENGTLYTSHAGWSTSSTTRAINDYVRLAVRDGLKIVRTD